jgi:hypothetical protein
VAPAEYRYIRPLLRPALSEQFAAKLPVDPDKSQSSKVFAFSLSLSLSFSLSLSPVRTITPGVAGAPPHLALLTLILFLLTFWRGSTPPQYPVFASM